MTNKSVMTYNCVNKKKIYIYGSILNSIDRINSYFIFKYCFQQLNGGGHGRHGDACIIILTTNAYNYQIM